MEYYILSLKWSKHQDEFCWWGPNNCGYTSNLKQAGLYTKEQIESDKNYYDNGETTKAIPASSIDKLITYKTIPTISQNAELLGLLDGDRNGG
ncbi:MAG: hypothetical protein ABFC57_12830 [Veillonellales bacterium]